MRWASKKKRLLLASVPREPQPGERRLVEFLEENAVGYTNAKNADAFVRWIHDNYPDETPVVKDRSAWVRGLKTSLVHDYGALIGSSPKGYFVIRHKNAEDEDVAVKMLETHFHPLLRTMRAIYPDPQRLKERVGQMVLELHKKEAGE